MKLKPELAQEIIDYTARIVSYVINIMDTDAIIIASTDAKRIGETHLAAKQVLSSGEPFVMDEAFATKNPLYVPGINLPIKFRNEIIGVLGVGTGDESRLIGEILLSTTELLVEQSFMQHEMNIEKQVKTEFLSHLLTESWHENERYFKRQMELHNLDISESYMVSCVEIQDFVIFQNLMGGKDTEDTQVVRYERVLNNATERLKQLLLPFHPTILFQPNLIVFLLKCDKKDVKDAYFYIPEFVDKLKEGMDHISISSWRIGIGGFANDMTEVHKYFRHAVYALRISKIIAPAEKVTSFRKFYTEYELLSLSKQKREHFYKAILGDLLLPENEPWLQTLELFFEKDKSAVETAETLFIHRNTLLFRFRKIEKITGLNPQSFRDSITLNEALTLWKLRDYDSVSDTAFM